MQRFAPLITLAEKAAWTYAQAFVMLLIVQDSLRTDTMQAFAIAALPAALTVIANGLPATIAGLPFILDLGYRTVRTYAVTFIGVLVAVPVFHIDASAAMAASAAALPAALAVIKGTLAKGLGSSNTAATLPARLDAAA